MVASPGLSVLLVCINRASDLASSLPTLPRPSQIVVVTTAADVETQRVCQRFGAEIVVSSRTREGGASFNKGALLNDGLAECRREWILATDADVRLPSFWQGPKRLDSSVLYGLNRVVFHDDVVDDREMPDHYVIGFFQLFSRSSDYYPRSGFPETYPTAGHYDIAFSANWPIERRRQISGEPAHHYGERGKSWAGINGEYSDERVVVSLYPRSGIVLVQNCATRSRHHLRITCEVEHKVVFDLALRELASGSFAETTLADVPVEARWQLTEGRAKQSEIVPFVYG